MVLLNALYYEGTLSICILALYFYIEPRFNVKGKGFFSTKNICTMIISIPFMEFLVGFLLQAEACPPSNRLCIAVPDLFRHTLYYDIFYLRTNDTYNGAHLIDYMFLPILYFITWYYTKDAFFSALNAGFMVFIHESIWFIFYWFKYYTAYQYEGWANDIAFFILVCTIGFVGLVKYRQYYRNAFFVCGIGAYVVFLEIWYYLGFKVTVINNTSIGNALKFLITQWYNDPQTNEIEVIGWALLFGVFTVNLLLIIYEFNTKDVLQQEKAVRA